MVEPGGELRQWLDAEHEHSVIERLHSVKHSVKPCGPKTVMSHRSNPPGWTAASGSSDPTSAHTVAVCSPQTG
jgi:hypothetical protein